MSLQISVRVAGIKCSLMFSLCSLCSAALVYTTDVLYLEGRKVQMSPVQLIELYIILARSRGTQSGLKPGSQGPPGPQSRVYSNVYLLLFYRYTIDEFNLNDSPDDRIGWPRVYGLALLVLDLTMFTKVRFQLCESFECDYSIVCFLSPPVTTPGCIDVIHFVFCTSQFWPTNSRLKCSASTFFQLHLCNRCSKLLIRPC